MTATKLTADFAEQIKTVRGVEYTFRELSANEYEEIVKLVTDVDGNAELNKVLKLMAIKAIVSPKFTADDLGRKPYPIYRELLGVVSEMHFSDMPVTKVAENGTESPNS